MIQDSIKQVGNQERWQVLTMEIKNGKARHNRKSGKNTNRRADRNETQDKREYFQCENPKDKERRMANEKEEGIQVITEEGGRQSRLPCEVKEGLSERRGTLSKGWEKKNLKTKKK